MRPATKLPLLLLALLFVGAARVAGNRVVRDRCTAALRRIPAHDDAMTVGGALDRLAPGGQWEVGPLDAEGRRKIAWRAGSGTSVLWEWSCRDEEAVPTFVAVSKNAQLLTPERAFP